MMEIFQFPNPFSCTGAQYTKSKAPRDSDGSDGTFADGHDDGFADDYVF